MKVGETLQLAISDVARGGSGVAKTEGGRTIFVPYTMTGDVVSARIIELKKSFANAELIEILEPAPGRQVPRCPVFGRCGGCQWQHIPYTTQWQIKMSGVQQSLKASQIKIRAAVEEYPADQTWNYRNRIQLRGHEDIIGYFAPRSHDIVAIERCDIAHARINSALDDVKRQGKQLAKPYKVEIEVTADGELHTYWNEQHAAGGFRQVNDEQNLKLKQWIQRQLTSQQTIYDLYGGSANLSREFAARGVKVHCVDSSAPETAPRDSPPSLEFHRAGVLPWLKQRITDIKFKRLPEPSGKSAALIDPPRGGLGDDFDEIIERLDFFKVTEIIAVGCKTDTWARDIARLTGRGWSLRKIAVFDFFPHTVHVETTACLTKS
jgi:tRNA/tmRNA/rRNA uracil-C5-methylase (TrmA/RlmC/RlmD family)